MIRTLMAGVVAALLVAGPSAAQPNRYESYTSAAAKGPHMRVESATYFGGEGLEEFVAGGELPDGSIVLFGNAVGPTFPRLPSVVTIGRGKHRGLDPFDGMKPNDKKRGRMEFRGDNPDTAGFALVMNPGLKSIKRAIRFDWGVASIAAARVTEDGGRAILVGRPAGDVGDLAARRGRTTAGEATFKYAGEERPADVYVAELDLERGKLNWVHTLVGAGDVPEEFWVDDAGRVVVPAGGLYRVAADGTSAERISKRVARRPARWLGIDPTDGTFLLGGDRNTNTGREPYRQPYLLKVNEKDEIVERFWEPEPRAVGANGANLQSDSSVIDIAFRADGKAVVGGWSDGGNSVFPRQVHDWRETEGVAGAGLGMNVWGMKGANSLGHLMLVDLPARKTLMHGWLATYVPTDFVDKRYRNAPNALVLDQIALLADESVAVVGGAATGLVQTPNAFYKPAGDGARYGGRYAMVVDRDFSRLLFSSYLPGCEGARVVPLKDGALVVSRSRGSDLSKNAGGPTASPVVGDPAQAEFGGGTDGHAIVLRMPEAGAGAASR